MFNTGFPPEWSTLKKLIWLVGSGIAGAAAGVWKTVTGTLIHITDALASPMRKCEVTLEPVQDLHGQDAPYPAGGGKNLMETTCDDGETHTGLVITKNQDGSYRVKGTTQTSGFQFGRASLKAGTYLFSQGNISNVYLNIAGLTNANATGASFTLAEDQEVTVRMFGVSSGVNIDLTILPMIRLSSVADSTYAPYANICTITGWTGCEVNRTGVNVWDEEWEVGDIDAQGQPSSSSTLIRTKNYNNCKPNAIYYIVKPVGKSIYFKWYGKNKEFLGTVSPDASTVTIPNNCYYFKFVMGSAYGTTYNHDISINYPSTDTSYHAYSGTTASVTFPDGQTVYGGTVDLVSGVLTVTHALAQARTDWAWQKSVSYPGGYYVILGSYYNFKVGVPFTSSHAKTVTSLTDYIFGTCYRDGSFNFRIMPEDSTLQDWRDYITAQANNGTPIQICCELATPLTYTLTPQEISTLKGVNNVWSNSNGDTTLIYKAQAE